MQETISILAEVDPSVHEALQHFLNINPAWDQDSVFQTALSLFLMRNLSTTNAAEDKLSSAVAGVYVRSQPQNSTRAIASHK